MSLSVALVGREAMQEWRQFQNDLSTATIDLIGILAAVFRYREMQQRLAQRTTRINRDSS